MRIISGSFKGKNLNYLKNFTTRPLKDIVKENIFNIINHSNLIKIEMKNSSVLDSYSGIGSFGLECISRGAKKVSFVEENKEATKILEKNIIQLSVMNKSKVYRGKMENYFDTNKKEKFNLIFFDPPFADNKFIKNLNLIKKNLMFHPNHLIIIHREKNAKDNLNDFINIIIEKKYGRSKIFFGNFI